MKPDCNNLSIGEPGTEHIRWQSVSEFLSAQIGRRIEHILTRRQSAPKPQAARSVSTAPAKAANRLCCAAALALLFIIATGSLPATTVVGTIQDITFTPYGGVNNGVTFTPLSCPQAVNVVSNGITNAITIWDVPRTARLTNGGFRVNLAGGIYFAGLASPAPFGGSGRTVKILVPPNDTNIWNFNDCARLTNGIGTFIWTNSPPVAITTNYLTITNAITVYSWQTNITAVTNNLNTTYQTNYTWVYYQAYTNTTLLTNTVNTTNVFNLTNGIIGATGFTGTVTNFFSAVTVSATNTTAPSFTNWTIFLNGASTFPQVVIPVNDPQGNAITWTNLSNNTSISNGGYYSMDQINGNMTIAASNVVLKVSNGLLFNNGKTLTIKSNASLTVYFDTQFDMGHSSGNKIINESLDVRRAQFYLTTNCFNVWLGSAYTNAQRFIIYGPSLDTVWGNDSASLGGLMVVNSCEQDLFTNATFRVGTMTDWNALLATTTTVTTSTTNRYNLTTFTNGLCLTNIFQ